ncbi:hypothetical protein GCM10008119_35900 [Pedobacter mendelii]|uniref:SusD family protein n=2 Tax=Pedobacter mendelii TaxID=1908240 RepID=A0ABQ2BN33_9SPHI|nr:hypothetical protein GCM10008119_35900 [Pedobacter mendelii]
MFNIACKKYLEEKPNKRISTPDKITDLQGILDNYSAMNAQYPALGEICADNYYLNDASWASSPDKQRSFYLWQKYDEVSSEWSFPYKIIFNANLIIETLPTLNLDEKLQGDADILHGQALFLRSYYHLAVAQLFAPVYSVNTAKALGIPLKLVTNVEAKSVRANVGDTYQQILNDAIKALPLLPIVAKAKYLPSKPAGYALISRINLLMGNYDQSALYADSCLQLYNSVLDYNKISATSAIPFSQFNDEVLYDCRSAVPSILAQTKAKVDASLYASYSNDDLRKVIFFKKNADNTYAFKGNYTGLSTAVLFSGIALDEVLLNRAECLIRMGKLAEGAADLNRLLAQRFKTGSYKPFIFLDQAQALTTVLLERRKELLFRNLRWGDLKRLNLDSERAITLKRTINGNIYTLSPNDKRYVLPIDKTVIMLSGMEQNP